MLQKKNYQRKFYLSFHVIHKQIATEGVLSEDDPTRLKGNLDNIGSSSDEEEEEEKTNAKKKASEEEDKTYKIPKITQTPYGNLIIFDRALSDEQL